MEKKKILCMIAFTFLFLTLSNLSLAAEAIFEIKSCKTSGNYLQDFENAKICKDLHQRVKVSWVDEWGNFRTLTTSTPFSVKGMRDPSKQIKVEYLGNENYAFLHWVQVDEEGNGALGGSNPYTDTQALSRTFVAFLVELPQPQKFRLTVKVVDCDCNNPISYAKVEVQALDDPLKYTNSQGIAEFELEKGNYRIKISKEGYEPKEVSVYLDEDKDLEVCLKKIEEKAHLKVKVVECKCNNPIPNAKVKVEGISDPIHYTNSEGFAEFEVDEGYYRVTVSKEGYESKSTTLYLQKGESKTLTICLEKIEAKGYLKIKVIDCDTHEPISNAKVEIEGEVDPIGYTNSKGEVQFSLPPGFYYVSVSKENYYPKQTNVYIYKNDVLELEICLKKKVEVQKYELKVKVVECDGNNPIPNAKVKVEAVSDPTQYTDSKGIAKFELEKGNYRITISKNGYKTKSLTIQLERDEFILVCLERISQPQKFELTLKVLDCDSGEPIENAKVKVQALDDPIQYTNEEGIVNFELEKGSYEIEISKIGYQTKLTSIYLNQDKYLEICLHKAERKGHLKIKVKDCDTNELIENARIEVDGKVKYSNSEGLAEFELEEGEYEIEVEKEGYFSEREIVQIEAGETKTLIICLEEIEEKIPYCELTLKDYEIYDKTVLQGEAIEIRVSLRMEFENLKDPFAAVKVELISEKDPFKTKVFEFEYSGQTKKKVFRFETFDLEPGTYRVYLSARGVEDCDIIEKTYLGKITLLAKPYSSYAEGFLDEYKCFDGELKRLYQHSDGSLSWIKVGTCEKQTKNYYKPIWVEASKEGAKLESIKVEAKKFEVPKFDLTFLWIPLVAFALGVGSLLCFLFFKDFRKCKEERFLISF